MEHNNKTNRIKRLSSSIKKIHKRRYFQKNCHSNTISDICINPQTNTPRYKIITDHLHNLELIDLITKKHFFKKPMDILFDTTYIEYSKEDIVRIGFICGQLSQQKIPK